MADQTDSLFSPEIAAFLQRLLLGGDLLQLGQQSQPTQSQSTTFNQGDLLSRGFGDTLGVPEFGALAGSPPRSPGGGPNLNILPAPAPDAGPTRLGNALVLLGRLAPLLQGQQGAGGPLEDIMEGLRGEVAGRKGRK